MLNGEAYELICEKALEDCDWRKVMEPARKENSQTLCSRCLELLQWIQRVNMKSLMFSF